MCVCVCVVASPSRRLSAYSKQNWKHDFLLQIQNRVFVQGHQLLLSSCLAVDTRVTFGAPTGLQQFLQIFLKRKEQRRVEHPHQSSEHKRRAQKWRISGSDPHGRKCSLLFCGENSGCIFCCRRGTAANISGLESLRCINPILPSGWRWSESQVSMALFS